MYYKWKQLQMQQINWDTPKWQIVANKLGRREQLRNKRSKLSYFKLTSFESSHIMIVCKRHVLEANQLLGPGYATGKKKLIY